MTQDWKTNIQKWIHRNPLMEIARQYPIHLNTVPGNKVVIVATRPPKSPLSGGMAPAVKQACEWADYKFWYAFGTTKPDGPTGRMLKGLFNGYHKKTVPISAEAVEGFRVRQVVADKEIWNLQYNQYCNRIVWPACHNLNEYSKDLEIHDSEGNMGANEDIARRIEQDLNGDKQIPIWIHDYHHLPLAKILRRLNVENPIVYFHHIPLPTLETLNERGADEKAHFMEMAHSLKACNAVLFQTEEVTKRFYAIIGEKVPESIPAYGGHFIATKTNSTGSVWIGHAPISINTQKEMSIALDPDLKTINAKKLDKQLVAENIFINFERCDYSKGILPRVKAFEQLMERRPDLRGKAQLVLGAEPTRDGIHEYVDYADKVKKIVDRINERSDLQVKGHQPIIFNNQNVDHNDVIRLLRNRHDGQRRIGLVTPHEDGMNLTAKEFAAAQDLSNAGPLVISSGAGAANELSVGGKGAIVYPKIKNGNVDVLVHAMEKAIDMPQPEANARAAAMQEHLKEFNIQKWAEYHRGIFEKIQHGTFHPKKPEQQLLSVSKISWPHRTPATL